MRPSLHVGSLSVVEGDKLRVETAKGDTGDVTRLYGSGAQSDYKVDNKRALGVPFRTMRFR